MLRVGIDAVEVDAVSAALEAHGERYLSRVYTSQEVADCRAQDGFDVERLAARYAAKEAAIKALRPAGAVVPWSLIEVRRNVGGWVDLHLTGPAAELAEAGGLTEFAVSLTHEAGFASAVVVAT